MNFTDGTAGSVGGCVIDQRDRILLGEADQALPITAAGQLGGSRCQHWHGD